MNRNARFWTLAAVFQVVFGLAVFGLTRQYYLDHPAPPAPGAAAVPHSQLSWPKAGSSTSRALKWAMIARRRSSASALSLSASGDAV